MNFEYFYVVGDSYTKNSKTISDALARAWSCSLADNCQTYDVHGHRNGEDILVASVTASPKVAN